jgi:hypothetical protein
VNAKRQKKEAIWVSKDNIGVPVLRGKHLFGGEGWFWTRIGWTLRLAEKKLRADDIKLRELTVTKIFDAYVILIIRH